MVFIFLGNHVGGCTRKSDGAEALEAYILPLAPYSVANRYEAVMTVWRELSYLYKKP
ncbi:hypothetical protein ABWK46_18200 [Peribacillus frigoritolerans]